MTLDRAWSWFAPRERAVFTGLLLVHLVLLWSFTYLPTQDGPSHLNNANVIRTYSHPQYPAFREYYALNTGVWANWLGHGVLAGLLSLLPPLVAEKVFASGYVLLFPLAVRYALRGIRPEAGVLSFLSFPLIYTFIFHMGFWSFCYSLAVFFLTLGFWLRHRYRLGPRTGVILALLALLLCLSHVLSFFMACLFITVLALARMLSPRRGPPSPRSLPPWAAPRTSRFRALSTAAALVPALSVAVVFVLGQGAAPVGIPGGGNPLLFPGYLLRKLMSLSSFREWEGVMYGGLGLGLIGMAMLVRRRKAAITRTNGWFTLVLVCLLVLYVAPERMSGGSFIPTRLVLFVLASLILWLGSLVDSDTERMIVVVVSMALSLALLTSHGLTYGELNTHLEEYVSGADHIGPNTTVLPICLPSDSPRGGTEGRSPVRPRPFLHAAGYIAAQRHVVDFTNYEATRGHFPILFRPDRDPYIHIGPLESLDRPLDFRSYPARTGGRVDYVLVWRRDCETPSRDVVESIAEQIRDGYEPVFTSAGGSMTIYSRRGLLGRDR